MEVNKTVKPLGIQAVRAHLLLRGGVRKLEGQPIKVLSNCNGALPPARGAHMD